MSSKLLLALSLIATLLHLSSCVSAIAVSTGEKQQTVTFQLPNEKSKLYINDSLYGQGENLKIKVPKRFNSQLRVETEGYKTLYDVLPLYKRGSKLYLGWLDIPVSMGITWGLFKSLDSELGGVGLLTGGIIGFSVIAPFDFGIARRNIKSLKYTPSKDFKKIYPNIQKQKEQKDVSITSFEFAVTKEKNTGTTVDVGYYFRNQKKAEKQIDTASSARATPSAEGEIKGEAGGLAYILNQALLKGGFIDSTNANLLKSKTNGIYLEGEITELQVISIRNSKAYYMSQKDTKTPNGALWAQAIFRGYFYYRLSCKWTIKDAYDNTKKEFTIPSASGLFAAENSLIQDSVISKALKDACENNLHELFENQEFKALLKAENANGNANTAVQNINRPAQKPQSFENAMQACATILVEKNKEKGHGSGFFISTDGYLITNYHVVANMDKITVKTNDGKTHSAKVLRFDFENDLALLKIEATSPFAFEIPTDKNYKIGIDVFTIGTPSYESLGQTLSKGILSGARTSEAGNEVLQTDVSVNPGNSGGPLLNKEFQLIGVVNSKLMGRGVEGIAFGSAAKDLLKQLNLAY